MQTPEAVPETNDLWSCLIGSQTLGLSSSSLSQLWITGYSDNNPHRPQLACPMVKDGGVVAPTISSDPSLWVLALCGYQAERNPLTLEMLGIEPAALCMQNMCSTYWAMASLDMDSSKNTGNENIRVVYDWGHTLCRPTKINGITNLSIDFNGSTANMA